MISVIVPAYNVGKTIRRALNSILAQTYTELEIIVVDDGSSDNTGAIIDQYHKEHPQRIQILHTKNEGVTSARMRGVKAAHGEWIGFVDGDDEIESDMYERLLDNAVKYNADISHCGYQMIFPDGRVHYFHNTGTLMQQGKTDGLKELLSGERIEPGLWNKLFHIKLFYDLMHNEIMPPDIKINEDLLMNYYLFKGAECSVFEDVCKYHYIVRSSSATRRKLNKHRIYDPVRVKKIIMEDAAEEIKKSAEKAYMSTSINVYNSLMLEDAANFPEDEFAIRKKIIEGRHIVPLLRKKQKLQVYMLAAAPKMYKVVYRIYAKYFMKNMYT